MSSTSTLSIRSPVAALPIVAALVLAGSASGQCVLGSVDTPGYASGVAVSGTVAYVADGLSGGLQVIDVSNPANSAIIGSVDTPDFADDVVGVLSLVAACNAVLAPPTHAAGGAAYIFRFDPTEGERAVIPIPGQTVVLGTWAWPLRAKDAGYFNSQFASQP